MVTMVSGMSVIGEDNTDTYKRNGIWWSKEDMDIKLIYSRRGHLHSMGFTCRCAKCGKKEYVRDARSPLEAAGTLDIWGWSHETPDTLDPLEWLYLWTWVCPECKGGN